MSEPMIATEESSNQNLWYYSLEVYGRAGFAEAALALQDVYDLDVNILLGCLWAGKAGHLLDAKSLCTLECQCELWRREIIEVFRALRRELKGHKDSEMRRIRTNAKARELDAEKVQQERIQSILGSLTELGTVGHAAENLSTYLRSLDLEINQEIRSNFAILLTVAFQGLNESEAESLLK